MATTRTDGRPHVAPVWFDLEGEQVLFWTDASSVKGRNIQWNPQVAICVDDDHPPFAFVLLEGRASIISDPDEVRECAQRIAARYLGVEDGRAFVERAFGIGDIIVRVPPEHVVALYPVVG